MIGETRKILNFGSCNIDSVYTLSHIVRPGETPEAALKMASAASSVTVSRKGAASSIPLREEVQRILEDA